MREKGIGFLAVPTRMVVGINVKVVEVKRGNDFDIHQMQIYRELRSVKKGLDSDCMVV